MDNAINYETIKIFVEANIFNACQAKLLNLDFKSVKIEVADQDIVCGDVEIPGYVIKGSAIRNEKSDMPAWTFSVGAPFDKEYEHALMHMIGATTMLLHSIAEIYSIKKKQKQKPILTVIKGGKTE